MMDYQKLIKDRRTAMGLTQTQLAAKVGVSQPHINDIENGKSKASVDVLFASATSSESGSLLKWRHKRKPGGSKGSFRLFVRVRAPD